MLFKKIITQTKTMIVSENADFKGKSIDDIYSSAQKSSENGLYEQAIKSYEYFIKNSDITHRNYLYAHYKCGLVYLNLNKPSKALNYFKEMLRHKEKITEILSEVYERQGFALLLMGKSHFKQALQSFNESLSLRWLALSLFHRGILHFLNEDYPDADNDIKESLKSNDASVLIAAVILQGKVMNKESELHNHAEDIISCLTATGCLQKPQQMINLFAEETNEQSIYSTANNN
jgi:tetratricopeptide (TPR) repeat protein